MTRYDLLDIRAALDKASYWARKQADLFQIIDAKKKVEALLNEPSLPSNLDKAAKEYACEYTENDNGNGGEDWEDDIRITFIAGAEWMAKQQPLPEDSVAFQKGVQEGKRLMMEGATYNELMELYMAIRDEIIKRHRDAAVNIKEKTMDLKEDTGNESALHQIRG